MIIYLVRHGKDSDTVRGGWSNQPLTQEGRKQVDTLAERILRNKNKLSIAHIYSSDLPRAMQTAAPVAQSLGLPVIPAPQFREVNNGDLAGMDNTLALKNYPGLFWNQLGWEQRYPNGESPRDFYERIEYAWEELTQLQQKNTLLVTHSGVIQVILSMIKKQPYSNAVKQREIGHCEIFAVEWTGTAWRETLII